MKMHIDYICTNCEYMDPRLAAFKRLLDIMDELREKCPWDREQSLESLRHLTLEETYELSDAIMEGQMDEIKKELGDLMLHIVFYAKIGSEKEAFDIRDVLDYINEKLVRRHPHIYANVSVNGAEDVKDNWEKIKMTEGRKSALEGVPRSMPPLIKAYRIQEKASGVGFDWEKSKDVWGKVLEEIEELQTEIKLSADGINTDKIEMEFGDLLFSLVNYSRFIKINPEDALERSNRKFIRRFQLLEEKIREDGKKLDEMTLSEMDVYWEKSKSEE